jgi:hypothetical protein
MTALKQIEKVHYQPQIIVALSASGEVQNAREFI